MTNKEKWGPLIPVMLIFSIALVIVGLGFYATEAASAKTIHDAVSAYRSPQDALAFERCLEQSEPATKTYSNEDVSHCKNWVRDRAVKERQNQALLGRQPLAGPTSRTH